MAVRVPTDWIEAGDAAEAVRIAEKCEDIPEDLFDNLRGTNSETGEEIIGFLVCLEGDEEYENSVWISGKGGFVGRQTCLRHGRPER